MPDYKPNSIILLHGVFTIDAVAQLKLSSTAKVFVCEGRPSLEAGRSNSKVLLKLGITPTIISDNMAGFLFFKGYVNKVVLACQYADKTGALCDTGALICAVLARKHKRIVQLAQGKIKTRFLGNPKDVLSFEGKQIAPKATSAYLPLVEWVPAKYLK